MPLPTNFVNNVGMLYDADAINEAHGATNDNADAIAELGGSIFTLTPPPTADWSNINFGTEATAATDQGDQLITVTNGSGVNVRARVRTLSPASNYTAVFVIDDIYPATTQAGYWGYGVCLRDSASGKLITLGIGDAQSGSSAVNLVARSWTNPTTLASDYATATPPARYPRYWSISDNGTSHAFAYSFNGKDWETLWSQLRTAFMTANQIGFWVWDSTAGVTMKVRLRSLDGIA